LAFEDLSIGLPAPGPLRLAEISLFLDLDGTLAHIVAKPELVRPEPRRTRLVERLQAAMDNRIAIVSGRSMEDVDRILEGGVRAVSAEHGLHRRDTDGREDEVPPHPDLDRVRREFEAFRERDSGLKVEEKRATIALHYRLAARCEREAKSLATRLAQETGLDLQLGDKVVELRTPGPNKGDSLRAFMAEAPFAGAVPVFVGDDLTDEHAFAAAQEMGGYGVLVGLPRKTLARFRLASVDDVIEWLEAAL